jgi:hypothetical protein
MRRIAFLPPLPVLVLLGALLPAQDARRHGADSPDRGLPRDPLAFAPYAAAADALPNRLFRAFWLQRQTPAEVAAVVPRGEALAWTEGWVHGKRAGEPADARWFGGDGRLLPLEGLDDAAAKAAAADLAALCADDAAAAALRAQPALAALFQHDLLRVAERLLDTKQNAALLPLLRRAAQRIALPADALDSLPDPLRAAAAADPALAAMLPTQLGGTATGFREVVRRSTRLFDAEKTALWSRVFLRHPGGEDALAALLPAALSAADGKRGPTVPIGFQAVLVQGLVGFDRDGAPRATPLVFDVRVQTLANRDPLGADNATFTHDGLDFAVWQLERQGLREGARQPYRRIDPDDQDLFRDYGTGKHTTHRGQCALCHRLSGTPEPNLGGFPVLRPHVQAAFAATGAERLRLAEEQAAKLWARLPAGE